MKKLLSRSLIKPAEQRAENDGSPPVRAASLPEGRNSEELAARQLKVQNKLALVLQDEKASMEDKLKSSADAIHSLNEQVTTLRQLLAARNAEAEKLFDELHELREADIKAREASKEDAVRLAEANAELQSLRKRVTELEVQAMKAEPLMRLGSPEKLASLVTRNTELVGELAEKDESVASLQRQLTETQAFAEEAVKEKDAELQSLRERFAELEKRTTKAEPLMRLGSPEKLVSLVTRSTELVGELAEKEESMARMKRQLTETQAAAEESAKDKDAEIQSLRERISDLEEQVTKAKPLMRLGSPEKLASLVTRNTELVGELAEKEESVSSLKRRLTETQAHAEEAARDKDAEIQSLRERLSDLEEQVTKAEPLMRLGSPEKLASLVTRNTELVGELAEKEESVSSLKRQLIETQARAEEAAREKDAELQSFRERVTDLEAQAAKAEGLMRLGSPEKLASLMTRNTELAGELAKQEENVSSLKRQLTETQTRAEEAVQKKDAELQSLRSRLADLEEQPTAAEALMRRGSPEKLASLVTRNMELVGELADKEESMLSLKRQLTETQCQAEEAAKKKDAEMQTLRERIAELEEQATKADLLTELVGEPAEKEESVSNLKRQLTQTQSHAEEVTKEKDAELQSLRKRLAEFEEQATSAEPLMRFGSPEKLASLVTKNEAAKEKDAELQSLRSRLAELEQQAPKAEQRRQLGSRRKLTSSKATSEQEEIFCVLTVTAQDDLYVFHMQLESLKKLKPENQDVGVGERLSSEVWRDAPAFKAPTAGGRRLHEAREREQALHEQNSENSDKSRHVRQEQDNDSARLLREAQEVEQRLQRQLQHVHCELEKMKKENQTLKETLMNTAQQSVDEERAKLQDRKEYENIMRSLQVATRDAQDCKYFLEMEKERRIAQVTRLKGQLEEAHKKLREQQLLLDMQKYGLVLTMNALASSHH
ncbi:hypothetical protein ACSSS7_001799 [Eimeria intestinalis]